MILTLIGMSGAGKTFWATRLAAHGFVCIHCDDRIVSHLSQMVGQPLSTMAESGRWLGFPHEATFPQREQVYLACEQAALDACLTEALTHAAHENVVIDTGGSAIYADSAVLRRLRQHSRMVYLTVPPSEQQRMLQAYLDNPRPLIWRGMFRPEHGESLQATFVRCYAQLLSDRARIYRAWSDVELKYIFHRQPALTPEAFISQVCARGLHRPSGAHTGPAPSSASDDGSQRSSA